MRISMIVIGGALLIVFLVFMVIVAVQSDKEEGKEISAPGAEVAKVKISVTTQPWSGWSKEQAAPKTEEIDLAKGQILSLNTLKLIEAGDPAIVDGSIKIEKINENLLTIVVNGVVKSSGGGIDLTAKTENLRYTVKKGETITLSTQTMDAGYHYTVKYISWSN